MSIRSQEPIILIGSQEQAMSMGSQEQIILTERYEQDEEVEDWRVQIRIEARKMAQLFESLLRETSEKCEETNAVVEKQMKENIKKAEAMDKIIEIERQATYDGLRKLDEINAGKLKDAADGQPMGNSYLFKKSNL